jgi:prepilin-type N-terminal cleavage/methylation domain-containing protein
MRKRRERGMTLLEIMIVLAILALVMGLVVGPKIMERYRDSQRKVAKLAVDKFADEAYPQWAVAHPAVICPSGLAELATSRNATTDPWGTDYKMHCGQNAPPSVAFGAASFGEDTRENTKDDIRSWE